MIRFHRWSKPVPTLLCTAALLFGACGKTLANPSDDAPAPAEKTSFDEVTARLDRGGSFYLYLSTEQWLNDLSGSVTQLRDLIISANDGPPHSKETQQVTQVFNLLSTLVKKSGIESVTGVGASTVALEPGVYRNTVFTHHDKGKDAGFLGSAFGSAPHALAALDFLPDNTALVSYGDFDLAQFITLLRDTLEQSGIPDVKKSIDQGLAQFTAVAGMSLDDALQSLGGAEGFLLTLDAAKQISVPVGGHPQMIPLPRLALLVQTKNDRIFERIDQMVGGVEQVEKNDEPGLRMRTMVYPASPDLTLRVTIAQWGNYLVIASDDQLIRDMIAAQKSGHGFKASPAFTKLSVGMPAEGNGFSIVTQLLLNSLKHFQTEMLRSQPGSTPGQAALMQKLMSFQSMSAAYTVSAHVENGWLSVSKSGQSINQALVPLMMLPVGMVAGMAMPVLNKVQENTKATKSLMQAKQIGLALKLYAGDNDGTYPPSLDELMPTYLQNKSLFISPFAPDEPMGYLYHKGLTDAMAPDSILVEDKYSVREGKRIVVHLDNSGEVLPAAKDLSPSSSPAARATPTPRPTRRPR